MTNNLSCLEDAQFENSAVINSYQSDNKKSKTEINNDIDNECPQPGYIYDWDNDSSTTDEPEVEMIRSLSNCNTTSTAYTLCEGGSFTVTHGTTGCCDGNARLHYRNGYTGAWSWGSYGTDQYTSSITNASPGTYTFETEIIGSNGVTYCTDDIDVTVYARPGVTSVSGGGDHCGSATLTATGGGGGTIYWQNTTSNGTSTSTASTSQNVTSSGTYYFRAENNGCWGTQGSATVNVQQPPTAPTGISGTTTICNGGSTTLTATGGTTGGGCTYEWFIGGCGTGSVLGTNSSITVSPTSTTNYFVRRVGTYPCGGVVTGCANVTVTVETLSTAPTGAIASPDSICEGSTITLNRVGGSLGTGASWEWYTGSCGGTNVGSGTFITVTPSPSVNFFYVRAEGNCNNTACATVPVTITPQSALTSVSGLSPLCVGDTEPFVANGAVLGGGAGAWTSDNAFVAAVNSSGVVTAQNPGTATITYTISGGCGGTISESMPVTVDPPPSVSVSTTQSNCGFCDGTASATTGLSSYSWSSGGTNDTETGLCGGSYSVTVTDANGCTNDESFTIDDVGTIPTVSVFTTDPSCPGDCDGTATVNSTGPATFTYNYSDGNTPNNQTTGGLCAGIYEVTVADGANAMCNTVDTFNISDPAPMSLTMNSSDAFCGLANGSASVSVGGNYTMPLYYNWSNGEITGSISGLSPGNYTVTVTDGNGCTAQNSITIVDTGIPFTVNTSVNQNAQCFGSCDGSATAIAAGSPGPYSYSWSSGTDPTIATVQGLCAGTHTVTVSEGACDVTATVNIPEPADITATISSNDAHCGQSDGDITVNASGGTVSGDYDYSWDCIPAQFTSTASNLPSGTYQVTVTDDNNCTASFAGSIMNVGGVTINETHSATLCSYSTDGSATINVLSGDPDFTYDWSHGVSNTTSATSHTLNNLAPGAYTVTVTDTWGCSAVTSFTIDVAPVLDATTLNATDISCNGLCDGTGSIQASGGTGASTYNWGAGNGNTPNQPDNTGLCPGNHIVTVTDANGCIATTSVNINEPPAISLSVTSTNSHCGQADGTASVVATGGTVAAGYSYLWSGGAQPTSANNTGLSAAGSPYVVTVTDDNNCSATATAIINNEVDPTISISNTTDITCSGDNDGTATVSIGGGSPPFSIAWGTTPVQNTPTATNLGPGTHFVTVTDMYGCTYVASAIINEPAELGVNLNATTIDCFGNCNGSAVANPNGGTTPYAYYWSDFQTIQTANGLCAGDYNVTITDDNGCTVEDSISITQNAEIVVTANITESDCGQSNGEIDLSVSGGSLPYDFDWDSGPQTEDILGIPAGTYEVTITDNIGCQTIEVFTVNDIAGPTVTISTSTDALCFGSCDGSATANVTGGTGPFNYEWNTTPVQTNPTATSLCAGAYTVEVTDMATGCMVVSGVTINEPPQLDATATIVDPNCNGVCDGEIQLTTFDGTPPYSYTWNGPGALPATEDLTGLCAGNYSVIIEDANGCSISRNYTLTEPSAISLTTSTVMTNCNGSCDGQATVNPVGGTSPYTYAWNDPTNQTTQSAVGLCPGFYNVVVTDDNGCTADIGVNVPDPLPLEFASTLTSDAMCFGYNDGDAIVNITGGTSPYSYTWSTGDNTNSVYNLTAGTHCVTIQDANNCRIDTCLMIDQPDAIDVSFNVTDENCNGSCDGEIAANVTGGTPGYIYNWSDSATSSTNNNLCVGLYQLTITDGHGCTFNTSAAVNGPAELNVVIQDTVRPHCGNSDGSITVGGTGGTPPYSYAWQNFPMNSTNTLDNIPNGNYTVTVTDSHSCTAMLVIPLNDVLAPVIDSINITNVDCYGNSTGEAEVFFTSATASNTIMWDDPASQSSALADNLEAGQYTVEVIDDNGCSTSETITITEPSVLNCYIDGYTDATCNGFCNGTAQAGFTGGTPPVSYSWTGGYNSQNVAGLCPGTYHVTVIDQNGCTAENELTISEPTLMTVTENITPVSCPGGNDGSISVSVTGGTSNYDYEWFGTTGNSPSVSGISSADYTVNVYNANDHNCFITETFFVPEPDPIVATLGSVNATCNMDNGSAFVESISGGTPGYNYTWQPGNITGTDSATNLAPGSYVCEIIDAYGCPASFNIDVGETSAPQLDNTIAEGVTCFGFNDGYGEVVVSGGSPPYTYQWNPNVTDQPVHDSLEAGLYMITVTDVDGCNIFATIPISSPDELIAIPSADDTICIGQTTNINVSAAGGSPPYTYEWELLGNGAAHNVSPEITTNYLVTVIDNAGCFSEPESVEITVRPPLDIVVTSPGAVCLGQTAILQATANGGDGDYTYNWGHGIVTENPQLAFSPETQTHFEVILTDGCGTPPDTAEITLTVSPQPVIDIVRTPTKGCAPLSVSFDNNTSNYTYAYHWNFDDEDSGDNNTSTLKNPVHDFEYPGYYDVSVVVTTDQGCSDSITVNVNIKENPTADFIAKPWTAGAYVSSVHFINQSFAATSWKWFFGDDGTSTMENPDHVFEENGDIPVKLIAFNNIGCTDTITQEVHIIEEHRFYMPTAINVHSPENNEFGPVGRGIDYDTYEMTIFNRWGELIFSTTDFDESWNGRTDHNKGDYVPNGTYTWVITLRDKFGKDHLYSGKVTVFK
ncbi:MAG: PKD domain-containing protein [Candidatus Delongbacteria bacterium]|nr:PKD domain-containing protein [Candidatus Delongbacteria bacterium]